MKIGLISNTFSQRNKRGLPNCYKSLIVDRRCYHAEIAGIENLPNVLSDFAQKEVDVVAVNGGDGSVAAVMTELRRGKAFGRLPKLGILPGGMTNMTAADVGMKGSLPKALARLLDMAESNQDPQVISRSALRLTIGNQDYPIYGMFFGAAAICRAIELCRRLIHPLKLESEVAAGATLILLLLRRALFGGDGDTVFRGDPMQIDCGDESREEGERLLVLVTTLERLVMGSRPFWGKGKGALHYTSVAFPPSQLARSVFPLLYGGVDRRLPNDDYASRKIDRISFRMACAFTLDGELFEASPDQPVVLEDGGQFEFLR